jgi:sterol 3beta-glucosyltransferase
LDFLDEGTPPVFIGFGSMPIRNPRRTTEMVLEALSRSGQRGVIHSGWGGLGDLNLPRNVCKVDYSLYSWLFARMAMIIHHGGSGTTAFGLRSGKPSCVVPFVFDQFYWGKRIAELGVGPRPIPFKKLTVDNLQEAIEIGVSDSQIQQNSSKLGERIRGENGIQAAVDLIEGMSLKSVY